MKSLTQYINEASGWKLDDEDWTLVNDKEDGRDLYAVRLWWGSGYVLDAYCAYADDEESALEYVVAWLEKNDKETLDAVDKDAEGMDDDEKDETFIYVDATMVGAKEPHYVYSENAAIEKFPKNKIPKKFQD